jgi:hypothetical protein
LVESESEVELAIGIFGTLKEATSLDQQFVQNFIEYVANLPSILRTQIHESFILWRYFEPEAITFDAIGVSRMEQERWETGGINAFEAGYWIARSISPEEAIGWKLGGILTPESARAWKTAKFTPSSATPWVEVGIDPAIAAEWSQEGYKPDIAAAYLKKNIPVPSAIPGRR